MFSSNNFCWGGGYVGQVPWHSFLFFVQDDASGSISDIARLVVSEMEMNQTATPPEDEDEDRVHETSAEMSEDVAEEVIFTTSEADSSDKILPVVWIYSSPAWTVFGVIQQ